MAEQPPEPGALAVMGFERPDVAVWVCAECSALVVDREHHAQWHDLVVA